MKITKSGIISVLVFVVVIPVGVDYLISLLLPNSKILNHSISSYLLSSYIIILPSYIIYLIIALIVIYLYNIYKRKKRNTRIQ
jgi:hypothetical protein